MVKKCLVVIGFFLFLLHLIHGFCCFLIDKSKENKGKETSYKAKCKEDPRSGPNIGISLPYHNSKNNCWINWTGLELCQFSTSKHHGS